LFAHRAERTGSTGECRIPREKRAMPPAANGELVRFTPRAQPHPLSNFKNPRENRRWQAAASGEPVRSRVALTPRRAPK
jgi:hypothetical protein